MPAQEWPHREDKKIKKAGTDHDNRPTTGLSVTSTSQQRNRDPFQSPPPSHAVPTVSFRPIVDKIWRLVPADRDKISGIPANRPDAFVRFYPLGSRLNHIQ